MPEEPKSSHSFLENIALGFSGGGYRASAFSLGILSFFNALKLKKAGSEGTPLIKHVKGISTVSGGTITGVMYALNANEDFNTFFKRFYNFLDKDQLVDTALGKFQDSEQWQKTDKRRSLINAFSLAYYSLLTDKDFDVLEGNNDHLDDVCFNATELSYGLAFRFQNNDGVFGNYRIDDLPLQKAKGAFKLADIIASSSCFPVGFAPMILPDDYLSHDSEAYKNVKQLEHFEKGLGILDGGIVDNQGIGSIVLTDDRREKRGDKRYDLIMICDVGSYMMQPWQVSDIIPVPGTTISTLIQRIMRWIKRKIWIVLSLVVGSALIFLSVGDILPVYSKLFIFLGGIFLFGSVSVLTGKLLLQLLINNLKTRIEDAIPSFFRSKLKFFNNLSIILFKRMLEDRMTSALKMVNEIFLKQIRRLNYNLFYSNEKLDGKRATALIYKLTEAQYRHNESDENPGEKRDTSIPKPSKAIFESARIASNMPTTLWFTEDDRKVNRLKNLVACGQFTASYTLLRYVNKFQRDHPTHDPAFVQEVQNDILNYWKDFIDDPYWLLKEEGVS